MYVFCILSGVILLNGCTALGNGNVKTSNVSESTGYVSSNLNTNHSYKAINTQVTNKKTKAVKQKEYDAAIENLSKLPEYILIRI